MKETLTRAVILYKETGEGWRDLLERISLIVYRYPGKWTDWDEDKCSDFFLQFFPKIPGIVKRFQPRFKFETFLSNSLEWFMKTFNEKQKKYKYYENWVNERSETEVLVKSELKPELKETETEKRLLESPENCPFKLEENGRLQDPALRRRILYAVLLRVADLDDHRIPVIATLVDVDEEWLYERTRKARNLISGKIERREKLRHRRNEYWYQFDIARKRLETVCDNERRGKWEKKAEICRHRYMSASRNIKSLHITTAHKDIGRLLDTPPGTVSSGLHLLRKKWHSMESWTSEGQSG